MPQETEQKIIQNSNKNSKYWITGLIIFVSVILLTVLQYLFLGPSYFKVEPDPKLGGVIFEVKKGMGAMQIARSLKDAGIISSISLFGATVSVLNDEKHIVTGIYLFKKPLGILEAESRITKGEFGFVPVKITIPEGFSIVQIANRLEANLLFFDKTTFLNIASTSEGYLFPETYFFVPSQNANQILGAMKSMFNTHTKSLLLNTTSSTKSTHDIIIMASIIEKEVKSPEDMKIVSGILWKRIQIGMALQVDATLAYERGLISAELTILDLKQDSPYNTYTKRGLPPTPIANPGINAIEASLKPTSSAYLYFLTDKEGKVYYAQTFEEHKRNKAKYL